MYLELPLIYNLNNQDSSDEINVTIIVAFLLVLAIFCFNNHVQHYLTRVVAVGRDVPR